mgnify:CR=1 FL=1
MEIREYTPFPLPVHRPWDSEKIPSCSSPMYVEIYWKYVKNMKKYMENMKEVRKTKNTYDAQMIYVRNEETFWFNPGVNIRGTWKWNSRDRPGVEKCFMSRLASLIFGYHNVKRLFIWMGDLGFFLSPEAYTEWGKKMLPVEWDFVLNLLLLKNAKFYMYRYLNCTKFQAQFYF